jgi:hypothetical protein
MAYSSAAVRGPGEALERLALGVDGLATVEPEGRTSGGLCRFPATKALHHAACFARRAERLLQAPEPKRLEEFAAD